MEQSQFSFLDSTTEVKRRDVFDEYSLESNYVLEDIRDLDITTQANYKSVNIGNRIVFVRSDIFLDIESYSEKLSSSEYKGLLHELFPNTSPLAHRVLRPFFRKRYESAKKRKPKNLVYTEKKSLLI